MWLSLDKYVTYMLTNRLMIVFVNTFDVIVKADEETELNALFSELTALCKSEYTLRSWWCRSGWSVNLLKCLGRFWHRLPPRPVSLVWEHQHWRRHLHRAPAVGEQLPQAGQSKSAQVCAYWAIWQSWFARVNALCNLSHKKSQCASGLIFE